MKLDLTGERFGKILVISRADPVQDKNGRDWPRWLCECDCGKQKIIRQNNLKNGQTTSCGCIVAAIGRKHLSTHGKSRTPEARTLANLKDRCLNPDAQGYEHYGARGITVCKRWQDSVEAFLEDMGPRPSPKHSIDRENVNGDYEPSNCRWATKEEQARNKTNNRFLEAFGQRKTCAEWCEEYGISKSTLSNRLRRGWEAERAISEPVGRYSTKG